MPDTDKIEEVNQHIEDVKAAEPSNLDELEHFRIKYLGSKGLIKGLFKEIKEIPNEQKKEFGQAVNNLKEIAQEKYESLKAQFEQQKKSEEQQGIDLSIPADPIPLGARHPVYIVRNNIVDIFSRIGFTISEGPEIEDDWHNFTALNTPEDHPARDMQDTFYIQRDPDYVLRTQTSSVQVHLMENQEPPIRTISPGRVYRNETVSARSHNFFHQVEGLYIDKDVSFADLKQTLYFFAREMFGKDTAIRLRPSYFPFTEPSAELDVTCFICSGEGCSVCKYSGWVEVLGCGIVDPAVLTSSNIDPETYSGFAFGIGIERIAMLKYRIRDIRLFSNNDVRFLEQFKAAR